MFWSAVRCKEKDRVPIADTAWFIWFASLFFLNKPLYIQKCNIFTYNVFFWRANSSNVGTEVENSFFLTSQANLVYDLCFILFRIGMKGKGLYSKV